MGGIENAWGEMINTHFSLDNLNRKHPLQYLEFRRRRILKWVERKQDRQCTYDVTLRRVRESLLP
jgi:hypothetical protein